MAGYLPYRVSKDGKTVSIGGKTYSVAAFRRQFEISTGGTDKAEGRGAAVRRKDAPKVVKVTTRGPEKPQTKAQQKANKKAVKQLNKRGFGKMLTEKEAAKKRPMPPKSTTTGRGGAGRGGIGRAGIGGGMNWSTK